jgi:hypothetical protein
MPVSCLSIGSNDTLCQIQNTLQGRNVLTEPLSCNCVSTFKTRTAQHAVGSGLSFQNVNTCFPSAINMGVVACQRRLIISAWMLATGPTGATIGYSITVNSVNYTFLTYQPNDVNAGFLTVDLPPSSPAVVTLCFQNLTNANTYTGYGRWTVQEETN